MAFMGFFIFLIIGIIFIIIGVLCIVLENSANKKCPAAAQGVVVKTILKQEWDKSENSNHRYLADHYYTVVSFNGWTLESKSPRTQIEYKDGEQVEVRYNPDNPEDFYIKGTEGIFRLIGWIMISAGILSVLVFAGVIVFALAQFAL